MINRVFGRLSINGEGPRIETSAHALRCAALHCFLHPHHHHHHHNEGLGLLPARRAPAAARAAGAGVGRRADPR